MAFSSTTRECITMKTEQYRFENGSLYEYDIESNSYIHCYKNAFANTKAKAIRAYLENYIKEQIQQDLECFGYNNE
tara:strand:+ start:130 stop:357 length:228 start_codon:yes stop_codon:yes gene_type:complete